MASIHLTKLPAINGSDDGVTLEMVAGGVLVSEDTSHTAVTDGEFRRDVISLDADMAVVVTEGAETADATKASAVEPALPEDHILVGVAVVTAAAGTPDIDSLERLEDLGEAGPVSSDE